MFPSESKTGSKLDVESSNLECPHDRKEPSSPLADAPVAVEALLNEAQTCDESNTASKIPDVLSGAEPSETASGQPWCDCCLQSTIPVVEELGEGRVGGSSDDLAAMYEDIDWVGLETRPLYAHQRSQIAHQVEAVRRAPFQLLLSALHEDPDAMRSELREWLSGQDVDLERPKVDLIEVFARTANLSSRSEKLREGKSIRIGLTWGQDLSRAKDGCLLLLLIGLCKPKDVWVAWPCRMNIATGGTCRRKVLDRRQREFVFLQLFEQIWQLQTFMGGHVHGENLVGSLAWQLLSLGPAYEVNSSHVLGRPQTPEYQRANS